MKTNKLIAGILSLCIIGEAMPVTGSALPKEAITVNAAVDDDGKEYTVGTYKSLTYAKYADHVVTTDCDESATVVAIPAEIEGLPVTSIGDYTFYSCTSLTSITIPDSVTSIGESAFQGCIALNSIDIPSSVTSIGAGAFEFTSWLDAKRAENPLFIINSIVIDGTTCEGDVVIPDGITSIGDFAFYRCTNLTSITIPDSVTSIGDSAFKRCTNLTSVTIPDSVTSIENGAFYECESLTSITILNPSCEINDYGDTICNGYDYDGYNYDYNPFFNGTIYGYENSTAQAYAEKYGRTFESLGEAPTSLYGDANDNGDVEVADAVFILQGLADPSNEEFKRSSQGEINADCHNTGNGVDSEDALTILKFKAQLIDSLPYQN